MAFEVSTVPAFLDAFRTQLVARAGLDGVEVRTALLGVDAVGDSIEFIDVEDDEEWGSIGNLRRDEVYIAKAQIYARTGGSSEESMKQARDRAYELLAEVAKELREDVSEMNVINNVVHTAQIVQHKFTQGVYDRGRWALITFQIRVTAQLDQV